MRSLRQRTPPPRRPPATYLSTARHVPYLLVRVRVRPERHRPQSCAIALRSLAPEGSYLILSLIPARISILKGPTFFPFTSHCIWIGHRTTILYLDAHPNTTTVVGHTLAIQRNRRASGKAYPASTTLPRIPSIGKITSLRVCVETSIAPLGDLNSACQSGFKRGCFEAN